MIYKKFKKIDTKKYHDVTKFLKKTTHLTAREWVIGHLCADFKNELNKSQMTWIGKNLKNLVPFMNETYTRQEVSNAKSAFNKKIQRSGTTFFYAYYAGLITQEEMIIMIHKIIADMKNIIEIEGGKLSSEYEKEVQILIADVLKTINENIDEEYY